MSKTDKTQPVWVKANDPQQHIEYHDHRHGICDIEEYDPKKHRYITYWFNHCHRDLPRGRFFYMSYPRGKSAQAYRAKDLGRERGELRRKIRDWMKSSLEDIYDDEYGTNQHRHNALWEAF
jgi:hypothetical protein